MRYRQPFDQTDPDASYQNANPALGRRGSILDIIAVEALQREVIECINRAGINSSDDDWTQLWQATRDIYEVDLGTTNALVIDIEAPPRALIPGMTVKVKKKPGENTGSCTLDIGLGTNVIHKVDGTVLAAGELPGGGVFTFVWDGAFWQLQNGGAGGEAVVISGEEPSTVTYLLTIPYAVDSSVTPNLIDADFSPAITTGTLVAGTTIEVKLNNTITGATTILVNAVASKQVTATDGSPLRANAGVVGQVLLLIYDGVKFQLANPNPAAAAFIAGVIYTWPAETIPAYTLECAGQSISRTTYAALFAAIGTRYGTADGASFNVPDLRGEFIRGWDHGRGVDPNSSTRTNAGGGTIGDHVGTKQLGTSGPVAITNASVLLENAMGRSAPNAADLGPIGGPLGGSGQNMNVYFTSPESTPVARGAGMQYWGGAGGGVSLGPPPADASTSFGFPVASSTIISATMSITGNSGSTETRPRNVNMMYIIGY